MHGTAATARGFAVWGSGARGRAQSRQIIIAANSAARRAGIMPGQTLADARAIAADLVTAPADAAADRRTLVHLAGWCRRYAPWTAVAHTQANTVGGTARNHATGEPGLWLDVAGCAHLFGGEEALARAVVSDLARAGFAAHAGLAGTPGAAWALARAGRPPTPGAAVISPPGKDRAALAALPVAALRLDAIIVETLCGLGLRRIGDLYPLAADATGRADLARRFPAQLLARLDAALGHVFEPISPTAPRSRHLSRFTAPEPVRDGPAISRILVRLAEGLAALLAREGLGARQIAFAAFRADGRRTRLVVGTARPSAEARTLAALAGFRLDHLDIGPGADAFTLEALTVEPLRVHQGQLGSNTTTPDADLNALAPLVERLAARLGGECIGHLALRPNHLPERAQQFESAVEDSVQAMSPDGPDDGPALTRPLRLLARPEAVAAQSHVPEGPPAWFLRHGAEHRVARADGPERIALDWWRLPGWQADAGAPPVGIEDRVRDYWRVEDTRGRRFWLYRDGPWRAGVPERWFLHGVFA